MLFATSQLGALQLGSAQLGQPLIAGYWFAGIIFNGSFASTNAMSPFSSQLGDCTLGALQLGQVPQHPVQPLTGIFNAGVQFNCVFVFPLQFTCPIVFGVFFGVGDFHAGVQFNVTFNGPGATFAAGIQFNVVFAGLPNSIYESCSTGYGNPPTPGMGSSPPTNRIFLGE